MMAARRPVSVTGAMPPACDMSAVRKWGKRAKTTGAPLNTTKPMTATRATSAVREPAHTATVASRSFMMRTP